MAMPSIGASMAGSSTAGSGGNVAFTPTHIMGRGNRADITTEQTYSNKQSSEATAKTDMGGGGLPGLGGLGGGNGGGGGGGSLFDSLAAMFPSVAGLFSGSTAAEPAPAAGGGTASGAATASGGSGAVWKWIAIAVAAASVIGLLVVLLRKRKR